MKKKILVVSLVVLMVGLGFVRDHIFVSLNQVIGSGGDSGGKLSMLKWVLTIAFSVFYFINTSALLFALFQSKTYIRIAGFSYVFLFAVSFLAALAGFMMSSFENVYHFVRMVMGIAQSPVVAMLLVPASWLNEVFKPKSS